MKLERLLAITMMLLNRKQMNAKELADYFEVSQRTIYRDIDTINQAGIPIVSYMGAEGGFGILENYKIGKNFFDDSELNSLVTALKNINNTVDNKKISATLEKLDTLKSVKITVGNDSENRNNSNTIPINIDYNNWNSNNKDKVKLKDINKAIYEKRIINFDYVNTKGEYANRSVEPLSLLLKDFAWYLQGYSLEREDFRLFKIKRMRAVRITENSFTREAPPLETLDYSDEWYKNETVIDISLKFQAEVITKVIDSFNEEQIQFIGDGTFVVNFIAPMGNWLYELILGFGGYVEVIKPWQLRKIIRQKAIDICDIYINDK